MTQLFYTLTNTGEELIFYFRENIHRVSTQVSRPPPTDFRYKRPSLYLQGAELFIVDGSLEVKMENYNLKWQNLCLLLEDDEYLWFSEMPFFTNPVTSIAEV